jgi:hypothetical protein
MESTLLILSLENRLENCKNGDPEVGKASLGKSSLANSQELTPDLSQVLNQIREEGQELTWVKMQQANKIQGPKLRMM